MANLCKGICDRYNILHSNSKGSPYKIGLFWCALCRKYYESQNIFISLRNRKLCLCCKTPVRSKTKWK